MKENRFWGMCCKHCGNWQVREIRTEVANKSLKCVKCNKVSPIKNKSDYGLSIVAKGPFTVRQANAVVIELNKARNEDNERFKGFGTYRR